MLKQLETFIDSQSSEFAKSLFSLELDIYYRPFIYLYYMSTTRWSVALYWNDVLLSIQHIVFDDVFFNILLISVWIIFNDTKISKKCYTSTEWIFSYIEMNEPK